MADREEAALTSAIESLELAEEETPTKVTGQKAIGDQKEETSAEDKEETTGEEKEENRPPSSKAPARQRKAGSLKSSSEKEWQKLERVCERLKKGEFKKILLITGAGISTAAGVPDFRSDDGLYKRLESLNLAAPELVFDIDYFRQDPVPFYSLAQELSAETYAPTFAHKFIKLLDNKGFLTRLYTQNIDGLDHVAGLQDQKIIEAHGSFRTASCIECGKGATEQAKEAVKSATVPNCIECDGFVKPDIVFFGESLPQKFYRNLRPDTSSADLCIVIGTSLHVMPVASVPEMVGKNCNRILINREQAGSIGSRSADVLALGEIEDIILDMAESCGWLEELESMEVPV